MCATNSTPAASEIVLEASFLALGHKHLIAIDRMVQQQTTIREHAPPTAMIRHRTPIEPVRHARHKRCTGVIREKMPRLVSLTKPKNIPSL